MGVKTLLQKLEVERDGVNEEHSLLVNRDLLPVPPENRTWTKWTCEFAQLLLILERHCYSRICALRLPLLVW